MNNTTYDVPLFIAVKIDSHHTRTVQVRSANSADATPEMARNHRAALARFLRDDPSYTGPTGAHLPSHYASGLR
jgi:hypothetical protein